MCILTCTFDTWSFISDIANIHFFPPPPPRPPTRSAIMVTLVLFVSLSRERTHATPARYMVWMSSRLIEPLTVHYIASATTAPSLFRYWTLINGLCVQHLMCRWSPFPLVKWTRVSLSLSLSLLVCVWPCEYEVNPVVHKFRVHLNCCHSLRDILSFSLYLPRVYSGAVCVCVTWPQFGQHIAKRVYSNTSGHWEMCICTLAVDGEKQTG